MFDCASGAQPCRPTPRGDGLSRDPPEPTADAAFGLIRATCYFFVVDLRAGDFLAVVFFAVFFVAFFAGLRVLFFAAFFAGLRVVFFAALLRAPVFLVAALFVALFAVILRAGLLAAHYLAGLAFFAALFRAVLSVAFFATFFAPPEEDFFAAVFFVAFLAVFFVALRAPVFLPEPDCFPPPSCLLTVAQAMRSAVSSLRPWSFALSSMCSAWRFCLSV